MKKILGIVVLLVLVAIGYYAIGGSKTPAIDQSNLNATTTESISVSETTKVSRTLSEYSNSELGFSVKYPIEWQSEESNAGVTFVISVDKTQVSTIGTLQANIQVISGSCAFPPVTTIKDRNTVKIGDKTFNTISMSNSVQGRNYFDRMYSLQKGDVCYMFSFKSISLSPSRKGLTGGEVTQAQNNNKAIVNTADAAFTEMVKSFDFVVGPQGTDEAVISPAKTSTTSTTTKR